MDRRVSFPASSLDALGGFRRWSDQRHFLDLGATSAGRAMVRAAAAQQKSPSHHQRILRENLASALRGIIWLVCGTNSADRQLDFHCYMCPCFYRVALANSS